MKIVADAELERQPASPGRRHWPLPLTVVAVAAYGFLLTATLSLPAVLVPGTRVGATLAGALIAGALAGRGKGLWVRAASGALVGLLLGAALSVAAWGLLSDDPNAALWQVTGLNILANSNIRPVDDGLSSWLGGYDQLEGHLIYFRSAASNVLLGLVGGLVGGLLASGKPRGRIDAAATEDGSVSEEPPADAEETAKDPAEGPDYSPPGEATDESGEGAGDTLPKTSRSKHPD